MENSEVRNAKAIEMKSYLIIVFGILIFSCNESENERKSYIKKNIIGKWCGFGGIKPILDFTSDSIYYYDRNKAYSYEITNGDIIINFPEHTGRLRNVSIKNDTLTFFDDLPEPIKAIKLKD